MIASAVVATCSLAKTWRRVAHGLVGDAVPGPDGGGGQAGGDQVETGRIPNLDAKPTLLA